MRVNRLVVIVFLLLFLPTSVPAIGSWGIINQRFKYDHLEIRECRDGSCVISGDIFNKTKKMKDDICIKIYAYNIHNSYLWSETLFFRTIPAQGKVRFSEKVRDCRNANPYKLVFEEKEGRMCVRDRG